MLERKEKMVQSITAYRCRVCKRYKSENLLVGSSNSERSIDLKDLLIQFFEHIRVCKIDRYTGRAFLLYSTPAAMELDDSIFRIHIQPNAGKALENFSVVNIQTNEVTGYKGEEHSAVYIYNVLLYIKGNANVFVFHHYGQSGCKTAFLNSFNDFLKGRGLVAHFDVLMSNEMLNDSGRYIPEKISLITTYSDVSSDKAENIGKKPRKKIEQETIIMLDAPKAKNIREWFKSKITKVPSVEELKSVLIRDNFPGEFEDAKVTVKFGKVKRCISISEFAGLIAEYDITDKLQLYPDGSIKVESLYKIADEYVIQFFDNE